MNKAWLGVFAALAIACSSSSGGGTTPPGGDGGTDTSGGGDTNVGDSPGTDTKHDVTPVDSKTDGPGGDGTVPGENTVGNTCTADTDCDPLGTGDNICATAVYPTPVCVGKTCDPGTGTSIMPCDNADGKDRGVCYPTSSGGFCFPACTFDDTGAAPVGCQGKDACSVFGWSTKAPITGVGICYGGCFADADCGSGLKCQTEEGTCTKTLTAFVKKPGDACTYKTASGATQDCNCYAARATNNGYCTSFCEIGDTAHSCPTGLTCSAVLPVKDATSGSALFTKSPKGISGYCLKSCTVDGDCTSLSSTCQTTADGKFCLPYTL